MHGREPESTREVFTGHSGWLGQNTLLHPVPKSLPWSPIHSQPCVYTWARIQFHTHTPPVPFPLVSDLLALGVPEPEPRTQLPRGAALGASHGCERRSAWRLPRRGTSTPSRPAPHLLTAARPHPSPTGAPGRRLGAASLETQGAGRSGSWAQARLLSQRVRHCKR